MNKSLSVYRRKGSLYFRSSSRTTAGVWIDNDPVLTLDERVTAPEKGKALLEVLGDSLDGIPHPTSWPAADDKVFWRPLGARSWADFVNGASCLSVVLDDNELTIRPTANAGVREGFAFIRGKEIRLTSNSSADAIGIALERAFEFCM